MKKLDFQEKAVSALKDKIKLLWKTEANKLPIIFKSPTGSGKTFMMASVIDELVDNPDFSVDKAYIWITFSDTLAMQSMTKFQQYFGATLKNNLLSVDDINIEEKLSKDNVLFLNWQKLIQNKASQRKLKLRKPEEEIDQKESGIYFDDFIDNTHTNNTEIILIIDESHKNATTELALDIVDYVNPRLIIDVSATPKYIPTIDDVEENRAAYVKVNHQDVVDAGLIREKIVLQSKDELNEATEEDLDLKLLELGIKRRLMLKEEYEGIGKQINPLMIIQLPNDDSKLKESGVKTKEEIVINFLESLGVDVDSQVARWFDGREENMVDIDYLESDVDFMLFKQAAGTGWDCPRAQVLVMFREIQTSTFYIQTVGRILRMTEPELSEDYKNYPSLKRGYLYTNYHRADVEVPGGESTPPLIQCTKIKDVFEEEVKDFVLQSDYISRIDYGDFVNASVFQKSFVSSLCKQLNLELPCLLDDGKKALEDFGVNLSPKILSDIITDTEIKDFDSIGKAINEADESFEIELSVNDIEKYFNFLCIQVLKEQTLEETKVGNISRSWGPLKSAIRTWFKKVLPENKSLSYYKIFIHDINKGANSRFRSLISNALKDYYPIKKALLAEREQDDSKVRAPYFSFDIEWCYDESYVEVVQTKYLLEKFYLKETYKGQDNEMAFAKILDSSENIKWWYKNGDSGTENFSLKYYNTTEQEDKLFYPDWIMQFEDGRIGIFDTKSGSTLNTEGRAKGLYEKLVGFGENFIGGIVNPENGLFVYCNQQDYNDITPKENTWKDFLSI